MGAEQFEAHSPATDAREAFIECVEAAQYDHGHSGYTGTIAEKDSFVIVDLPSDLTIGDAVKLLQESWDGTYDPRLPTDAYVAYDDKWGPAVAFKDTVVGGWYFCGWASS